jgi:ABC-type dipeptide/oligopeptide/nickel transport system permease component
MRSYLLRRIGNSAIALLSMTLFVFVLLRMAPGSPVSYLIGEMTTAEEIAELERQLGFDQPYYVQYWDFLSGLLTGDFGQSVIYKTSAFDLVIGRLPATIELTLMATLISTIVAIPLGILVALRQNTWVDYTGSVGGVLGVSVPNFWLGFMLILVFSVMLGWTATSGRGGPIVLGIASALGGDTAPLVRSVRHLALPALTLSSFQLAFMMRMTRSSILEELGQNYIRAARARGLPRSLVIGKHALRNAMLPILTVLGLEIGSLLGGAVVVEAVFSWPGVGHLIYESVSGRDYPLAQAGILVIAASVILVTLVVDMLYGVVDPRIRYR